MSAALIKPIHAVIQVRLFTITALISYRHLPAKNRSKSSRVFSPYLVEPRANNVSLRDRDLSAYYPCGTYYRNVEKSLGHIQVLHDMTSPSLSGSHICSNSWFRAILEHLHEIRALYMTLIDWLIINYW